MLNELAGVDFQISVCRNSPLGVRQSRSNQQLSEHEAGKGTFAPYRNSKQVQE
jgi:hypothetical protein